LQLLCAPLQGLWSALQRQRLFNGESESGDGALLFDAIVADPPYDMKEAVRSASTNSSTSTNSNSTSTTTTNSNSTSPSTDVTTGAEGTGGGDAAEEAVVALLALAAAALRPQGRLVFFLPHRHARRPLPLRRIGLSVAATAASAAAVPGSDGEEEEQDGAMGMGMGMVGMSGKMARRKSFRAAARRRLQGPSPSKNAPPDPSAPAAGPIDTDDDGGECPVLRLLRAGGIVAAAPAPGTAATAAAAGPLRVLSTHRQILSPTFSRWLCVLEKR
jgi:hypothetical protein